MNHSSSKTTSDKHEPLQSLDFSFFPRPMVAFTIISVSAKDISLSQQLW